jgi:putative protein-disulfide isomerase
MDLASPPDKIGILYYFGDPMCSWCWGFRPVLEQVEREYPELQRVTVMGGLRGGAEEPMGDMLAEMIQTGWNRIHEATGQPFNWDLWKNHRPLATTWPACRAVLAARLTDPALEWPMMVGLFKAYFTQALDPSRVDTQVDVAADIGLAPEAFRRMLGSAEVEHALQEDLRLTKRYGITGFPSVVLTLGTDHYLVSPGYQPIESIRKIINRVYTTAGIEYTRPESGIYS